MEKFNDQFTPEDVEIASAFTDDELRARIAMKTKKIFTITETGKAEILSLSTCPICGAGRNNDLESWSFVSGCWNKSPLVCHHGFWITENMNNTGDAANDDWQESIIIRSEYIPELEALGYSEASVEPEGIKEISEIDAKRALGIIK